MGAATSEFEAASLGSIRSFGIPSLLHRERKKIICRLPLGPKPDEPEFGSKALCKRSFPVAVRLPAPVWQLRLRHPPTESCQPKTSPPGVLARVPEPPLPAPD